MSRLSNNVSLYVKVNGEFKKINIEDLFDGIEHDSISIDEIFLMKNKQFLKIRLVGFKLPPEKANLHKSKLRRNAKKRHSTPKKKSLILAGYTIFVTNAEKELIPDDMIRTYYRLRWNVELIFKSFKSVLKIDKTNVISNEHRLRCELYARLILVAIVHKVHFVIDTNIWNLSKKELSLDKFWKYIDSEKETLCRLIKKGCGYFLNYIINLQDKIIYTCEKLHQKTRKTTREMIQMQIGDTIPVKIDPVSLVIK